MSNLIVGSSVGEIDEVGLAERRPSPRAASRRARGLAELRRRAATGLIWNVSPSSPSILRRSKTTLAASTCVARPVASRVKTSFSPWYSPRSRERETCPPDSSSSGYEEEPLDQGVQLAVLLEDVERRRGRSRTRRSGRANVAGGGRRLRRASTRFETSSGPTISRSPSASERGPYSSRSSMTSVVAAASASSTRRPPRPADRNRWPSRSNSSTVQVPSPRVAARRVREQLGGDERRGRLGIGQRLAPCGRRA